MATGLKARLDYNDYCAIPPDGKRCELIDGEVRMTPAPSPQHQRVVLRLARLLSERLSPSFEVFVSPIDVILTPNDVVQPDIVVVSNPAQVSSRGIEGPPLLVIEVLSPTTTVYDRTAKAQRFAALGVPHYWLADPSTRILECFLSPKAAYQLVAAFGPGDVFAHPDFAGLQFPLAPLWT